MSDQQEILPETLVGQPDDSPAPSSSSRHDAEPEDQAGLLASLPDFRAHHRGLLRACMAILLLILSVQWVTVALQRPEPLKLHRGETFRQQFRVNVNDATWVEWMQLEGIGISMAHRIVADRTLNGPFQSVDDLARVPGIGKATLDQIRPWLTMGHDFSKPQSFESSQNVADEQQAFDRKPSQIRSGETLRR